MVLSTENVIELCINELQSIRTEASTDCRSILEIVHRAIVEQSDEAWSILEHCFYETVRIWIYSQASSELALQCDTEENYIAQTFSRFWYATRTQKAEFMTLPAVLSYLHATLNGVMTDTLRFHSYSREVPFPEAGITNELAADEMIENECLWEAMQKLLHDEHERRVFYLLYACGLKPREIVIRCTQEFPDVKEIYRLNKNIIERLRRNRSRLRYLFDRDE